MTDKEALEALLRAVQPIVDRIDLAPVEERYKTHMYFWAPTLKELHTLVKKLQTQR